jgi:hypothetical protein
MAMSAGQGWTKSSRSNNGGSCVEVAVEPGGVLVRDSKNPGGHRLTLPTAQWAAFTAWASSVLRDPPPA